MKPQENERLTQLLADRATEGLLPDADAELRRLRDRGPEADDLSLELAAAAIHISQPLTVEPLPFGMRARLLADAETFFQPPAAASGDAPANVVPFPAPRGAWRNRSARAGWLVAAAAMLLAALGWLPWAASKLRAPEPPESRRERLLAAGRPLARADWASPSQQPIRGDVVWDNDRQEGYLAFEGLPVNDPKSSVYQLWIFDAEQDERYPIDGGIFDIDRNGRVIVPINAKLKVARPVLFAVTIEKPGGVVVSKRDRLVLTARV